MPSSAFPHPPRSTLFPYTTLFRSLFHALGIVLMGNDVLSPGINLIWLALTLLAAWCIGSVRGLGSTSMLAAALVMATPMMVGSNAGDRKSTRLNSSHMSISYAVFCFPAPTALYTLSLHDALPISVPRARHRADGQRRSLAGHQPHLARAHVACGLVYRFCPGVGLHVDAGGGARHGDADDGRQQRRRSEEHTSELQSHVNLVCRLLLSRTHRALHSFPTRRSSDLCSTRSASC